MPPAPSPLRVLCILENPPFLPPSVLLPDLSVSDLQLHGQNLLLILGHPSLHSIPTAVISAALVGGGPLRARIAVLSTRRWSGGAMCSLGCIFFIVFAFIPTA